MKLLIPYTELYSSYKWLLYLISSSVKVNLQSFSICRNFLPRSWVHVAFLQCHICPCCVIPSVALGLLSSVISILLAAQPIWDWFLAELSQFLLFCPHFLPDLIPALSSLSIYSLGHTKSRLSFRKGKLCLPQEQNCTSPTSRSPHEVDTSGSTGRWGQSTQLPAKPASFWEFKGWPNRGREWEQSCTVPFQAVLMTISLHLFGVVNPFFLPSSSLFIFVADLLGAHLSAI